MKTWRQAETSTRPLKGVLVDSAIVAEEWKRCWADHSRDMTSLMQMLDPFILYWQQILTSPNQGDVNYISLCSLISSDYDTAINSIASWIEETEKVSCLYDDLVMLVIEHVRTSRYFPHHATPRNAELTIALDFKKKLKNKIVVSAKRNKVVDTSEDEAILNSTISFDCHPDYFLIKNLGLGPWDSYMLLWLKTGRSNLDISNTINLPAETLKREERYLWDYLKQSYFKAEV